MAGAVAVSPLAVPLPVTVAAAGALVASVFIAALLRAAAAREREAIVPARAGAALQAGHDRAGRKTGQRKTGQRKTGQRKKKDTAAAPQLSRTRTGAPRA